MALLVCVAGALLVNVAVARASAAPTLQISSPADGFASQSAPVIAFEWTGTLQSSPPICTLVGPSGPGSTTLTASCANTTATAGGGTGLYLPVNLGDGSYTFTVTANFNSPCCTAISSSIAFTVDNAPPSITITSPVNGASINDSTPDPAWVVSDDLGTVTIECRIDDGTLGACPAGTIGPLADGIHGFSLRAIDGAGNVDTKIVGFTVDTAAPVITITPFSNNATNINSPAVVFTVSEAGTIKCRIDSGLFGPCSSPITPAPLADGGHSLTVTAIDGTGNASSAAYAFIVDTVAPEITVTSPRPGQVFDDEIPELAYSITGLSPGLPALCRYDENRFVPCGPSFDSTALADGFHTLTFQATDAAGNTTSYSVGFRVDAGGDAGGRSSASIASFKVKSTRVKNGRFRVILRFKLKPPGGVDLANICAGKVTFIGRPAVKKAKRVTRRAALTRSGNSCMAKATFTLSKKFKRRSFAVQAVFPGNGVLGESILTRKIKRL